MRGRHTSWKRLREVRPLPEQIGALGVETYDTSHGFDTEDSRTVCFVFRSGKKGFGVVTDLGSADKTLTGALSGLDGILLAAERIPMPALHATYRIGLEPGAPGPVLEL